MARHIQASEASFVGTSAAAQHLRSEIDRLSQNSSCLILVGEPGVGKRFIARLIHAKSAHHKGGSLVELSPESPEMELKATLFNEGRKRAEGVSGRPIPRVDARSTLFIRKIHEFSLINQTRLARFFIQNNLGTGREGPGTRVILSSPAAWAELVAQKMVVASIDHHVRRFEVLAIPPLRERREDVAGLAQEFLRRHGKNRRGTTIDPRIIERLEKHPWPDNVRELELLIQEAAESSPPGMFALPGTFFDEVEKLQETIETIRTGRRCSLEEAVGLLEAALIQRALRRTEFDRQKAARLLGMNEKNLLYRIKKHNVWTGSNGKKK